MSDVGNTPKIKNVLFVNALKFNFFCISQLYNKRN